MVLYMGRSRNNFSTRWKGWFDIALNAIGTILKFIYHVAARVGYCLGHCVSFPFVLLKLKIMQFIQSFRGKLEADKLHNFLKSRTTMTAIG